MKLHFFRLSFLSFLLFCHSPFLFSYYSLSFCEKFHGQFRSHVKDETPTEKANSGTRSQSWKLLVNFSDRDELPLIASADAKVEISQGETPYGWADRAIRNNSMSSRVREHYVFIAEQMAKMTVLKTIDSSEIQTNQFDKSMENLLEILKF